MTKKYKFIRNIYLYLPSFIKTLIHKFIYISKFPNSKIDKSAFVNITNLKDTQLGKKSAIGPNAIIKNCPHFTLGKGSAIGANCDIDGNFIASVEIGNFCMIASNVQIIATNHNHKRKSAYVFHSYFKNKINRNSSYTTKGDIKIGHDVWIGRNVIIMSGINIGNGAIIGAGSVVTKDVEPFSIYGGVPAKKIRNRFSEDVKTEIEKTKWWEKNDKEILELYHSKYFDL